MEKFPNYSSVSDIPSHKPHDHEGRVSDHRKRGAGKRMVGDGQVDTIGPSWSHYFPS